MKKLIIFLALSIAISVGNAQTVVADFTLTENQGVWYGEASVDASSVPDSLFPLSIEFRLGRIIPVFEIWDPYTETRIDSANIPTSGSKMYQLNLTQDIQELISDGRLIDGEVVSLQIFVNDYSLGIVFFRKDTSFIYGDTTTGISDKKGAAENASLYPNPTTNVLHVTGINETHTVSLYDLSGREVFTGMRPGNDSEPMRFDLPTGIYAYQIQTESGSRKTGRLAVQH